MHANDTADEPVIMDDTLPCMQKSFEYSHGPGNPRNLRTLAMIALSKHFPRLDPLDVAILFAKKNSNHDNTWMKTPSDLAHLCREFMSVQFPELDIDLHVQRMLNEAKQAKC